MKKLYSIAIVVFACASATLAQQKLLTLDDIFSPDPKVRVAFNGRPVNVVWAADGLSFKQTVNGRLMRVDAKTGEAVPYYDSGSLSAALVRNGVKQADADGIANSQTLKFSPNEDGVLVNTASDLWYYKIDDRTLRRLTNNHDDELEAEFSPDGRWVSFVRHNDLFVVDVVKGGEKQITRDGREGAKAIYNGYLDWVYEEELYGRGTKPGYWWSPDSKYLAFLRLDESNVPRFTIVNDIPTVQTVEEEYYPRPGEPNPIVKLGIAEVGKSSFVPNVSKIPAIGKGLPPSLRQVGDLAKFVDLGTYKPDDLLIGRVAWSADSRMLTFQAQNREQTYLDLNAAGLDGKVRTLFKETSPAWVSINENPFFLKDGSFIWASERDGFEHLYRYSADGQLIKRLTDGKWEIRSVYGVDEANGWIYFSSIKDSPIAENVYRVRTDGGPVERVSQGEGWHSASFNKNFSQFVETWSDAATPAQTRLRAADGSLVRVINENNVDALAQYKLSSPEFVKVKTRDGFEMDAMMIKPTDFDPSKRYPVLEFTYSGPHAPQVANRWGASRMMWFQMLAEKGYLIWVCDNRTASGKGVESTWPIYKNMYKLELRDLEDGLNYLKGLPFVDGTRIALHGWSYGGSMTTYAMLHSKAWKVGIAGGTVSDELLYDSIYTERYMMSPQNNRQGYADTDMPASAANLSGKLLLIHGGIDDNVHLQNTLRLAYALQKADKQFELMIYPTARHGLSDQRQIMHWYRMMTEFLDRNL
jgi:dipeptidyl-peptidase-4